MLSKIYFSRSSSDSSESSESETETEGSKLEAETDAAAAGRNRISKKEKLTLKTDQKAKGYPAQKKRYVMYYMLYKTINIKLIISNGFSKGKIEKKIINLEVNSF